MYARDVVLASFMLALIAAAHLVTHLEPVAAAVAARAFYLPVLYLAIRGGWRWGAGDQRLGRWAH